MTAPVKTGKIIIIGDTSFAEIACEYFSQDTPYEVVGFSVEFAYLKQQELCGLSVIPFETLEQRFVPAEHSFFVACTYTQLNRLRTRLYHAAKAKGYKPASYISPRAFVWRNVEVGEHCFIFEDNVVQPFVAIGDNVVLWSGNHIGHHSTIGDNTFVASHVVVSGHNSIGKNCFLGVNATLINNLDVGDDCIVGAGALVTKNMEANHVAPGAASATSVGARRLHRVKGDE